MKPKITVESAFGAVKIKFGEVVHISFRIDAYIGFHAWEMNSNHYYIDIRLKGTNILAEYDSYDKWKYIITNLDKAVAQ